MDRFTKNVQVNFSYWGAGALNTPQNILDTKKSLNPPKKSHKKDSKGQKIAIKAKQTTI